jgi:hypothetical protein
MLTIFNILAEARINLRGDLRNQGFRRGNIHKNTVVGFSQNLLHRVERDESLSGTGGGFMERFVR